MRCILLIKISTKIIVRVEKSAIFEGTLPSNLPMSEVARAPSPILLTAEPDTITSMGAGTPAPEGAGPGKRAAVKRCRGGSSQEAVLLHCKMLRQLEPGRQASGQETSAEDAGEMAVGEMAVGEMGKEQVEELKRALAAAEEVAMTLVYSDGDTQLSSTADVRSLSKPSHCPITKSWF